MFEDFLVANSVISGKPVLLDVNSHWMVHFGWANQHLELHRHMQRGPPNSPRNRKDCDCAGQSQVYSASYAALRL
jgi:hypothetical protein